jgi:hypothetical protein
MVDPQWENFRQEIPSFARWRCDFMHAITLHAYWDWIASLCFIFILYIGSFPLVFLITYDFILIICFLWDFASQSTVQEKSYGVWPYNPFGSWHP